GRRQARRLSGPARESVRRAGAGRAGHAGSDGRTPGACQARGGTLQVSARDRVPRRAATDGDREGEPRAASASRAGARTWQLTNTRRRSSRVPGTRTLLVEATG